MDKRVATLYLVIVLLAVSGAIGWYRYLSIKGDYLAATNRLEASDRLRTASENFTAARFVRAVSLTEFVFGTPVQITRDGQTFVDYIEHTGTLTIDQIYRASNPSGQAIRLSDIPAGQEIRLDMRQTNDSPPRFLVDAIYIID